MRRDLLRLRNAALPLIEVCRRLEHAEARRVDATMQPLFRDVTDHVHRVQEEIDSLREVLAFAFEASLMTGQAQQAHVTRQLAAWAAILAVPTAVAGIYGMNLSNHAGAWLALRIFRRARGGDLGLHAPLLALPQTRLAIAVTRRHRMPERSAGILLYRIGVDGLEVLLVHPGGPFWAKKDDGAWSIPKGLVDRGEDPLAAARREFFEETGNAPEGAFLPLGDFRYSSGKIVSAWAVEGDFEIERFRSGTFEMEWPPRSGRLEKFPEADRAAWFAMDDARRKILKGQAAMLDALRESLKADSG